VLYLAYLSWFSCLILACFSYLLVPHWLWWKISCDVGLYKAKTIIVFLIDYD